MPTTRFLIGAALLSLAVPAAAQQSKSEEPALPPLSRFTSETLTRFSGEEEFRLYLEAVDAAQDALDRRYSARRPRVQFAALQQEAQDAVQSDAPDEPVCEDPALCPEAEPQNEGDSSVVVTGSRASPSNPSITNNQMAGVDEGDIVKQIGQYLIVLQDGRLFVIDTRPGGRSGMQLADRADVYRDPRSYAWYDEMLVQGDRIVVTAYSYGEGASEVSVFRLDDGGRVHREGVFLISSNDYYSARNYATRLVGDSLVVYTPYSLDGMGDGRWPTVRRWLPEEERTAAIAAGRRLFDAARIHRPVRDVVHPEIHTISVCPLGPVEAGRDLSCRTTAFVGPENAQLYVTDRHAYLWTTPGWRELNRGRYDRSRCSAEEEESKASVAHATVFRVPVAGGPLEVLAARGTPIDQFSLQASVTRLYSLLRDHPAHCRQSDPEQRLAFASLALTRFAQRLHEVPEDAYTELPGTDTAWIANRFTDEYLVYGSLTPYWQRPTDEDERYRVTLPRTFAVPVERPQGVRQVPVPHNVLRAERAGNDIVLTGYRDRTGLRISLLDLDRGPRVSSTAHLPKRFESEGRSHAFNSLMQADGSGLIGLPTVYYDSGRPSWRSEASDISYLSADAAGRLAPLGELLAEDEQHHPSYRCEVSCIDWYGNSRPIFTEGRVFGLSGTELVEGRVAGGQIGEIARLDLTAPPRGR